MSTLGVWGGGGGYEKVPPYLFFCVYPCRVCGFWWLLCGRFGLFGLWICKCSSNTSATLLLRSLDTCYLAGDFICLSLVSVEGT